MIDYSLDPNKYGQETVGNTRDHAELLQSLNYLVDEGFIELKDNGGEIRLYPSEGSY